MRRRRRLRLAADSRRRSRRLTPPSRGETRGGSTASDRSLTPGPEPIRRRPMTSPGCALRLPVRVMLACPLTIGLAGQRPAKRVASPAVDARRVSVVHSADSGSNRHQLVSGEDQIAMRARDSRVAHSSRFIRVSPPRVRPIGTCHRLDPRYRLLRTANTTVRDRSLFARSRCVAGTIAGIGMRSIALQTAGTRRFDAPQGDNQGWEDCVRDNCARKVSAMNASRDDCSGASLTLRQLCARVLPG
jgi:hypothetical protein